MSIRKNHRFLDLDSATGYLETRYDQPTFDLDESDIYDTLEPSFEPRRQKKPTVKRAEEDPLCPHDQIPKKVTCSLPVNIPDWSKIPREEYRGRDKHFDDEDEGVECCDRLPPHEFLARTRVALSLSGRSLKGKDLNRVRNAIWAKIGFQD